GVRAALRPTAALSRPARRRAAAARAPTPPRSRSAARQPLQHPLEEASASHRYWLPPAEAARRPNCPKISPALAALVQQRLDDAAASACERPSEEVGRQLACTSTNDPLALEIVEDRVELGGSGGRHPPDRNQLRNRPVTVVDAYDSAAPH